MTKTCTYCKCEKLATNEHFGKRAASKDGLQYVCKTCCKQETYGWRERNPEKFKAHQKAYRERQKLKPITDPQAGCAIDPFGWMTVD